MLRIDDVHDSGVVIVINESEYKIVYNARGKGMTRWTDPWAFYPILKLFMDS